MISTSETSVRRLRGLAAVAAIAALLTACTSSGEDTTAATSTSPTSGVSLPVTPVTTTLLDPGAEPRSAVTSARSGNQTVLLSTRSAVTQQIDDQAVQDFSTPELTLPLTATDMDSSGTVSLRVGTATSADQRLTDALAPAEGSVAGLTMTDTGAITALTITPSDETEDSARAAIEQALNQAVYRSISYPDAEIGVGAVWTVEQQVISGVTLNQVTTATLRSRDGDRMTIDLRIDQTPESSTLELPDDTGSLNIDSYTMTGTGTLEVDAGAPLPLSGEVTVGGKQQYSDPDGSTVLRQDNSDTVRWTTP